MCIPTITNKKKKHNCKTKPIIILIHTRHRSEHMSYVHYEEMLLVRFEIFIKKMSAEQNFYVLYKLAYQSAISFRSLQDYCDMVCLL